MLIMTQNGRSLVNVDQVAALCIEKNGSMQDIVAVYGTGADKSPVKVKVLGTYQNEKVASAVFLSMMKTYSTNKMVFVMPEACGFFPGEE